MKVAFVLSLLAAVVVAQRDRSRFSSPTPRPSGTEAPPRCSEDVFTIIRNCHVRCLVRQVGGDMDGCTRCNETCNEFIESDDDLEEPDDQERNQVECRVNATFFATLASCRPRCVERRIYDGCFMCDRECNATDTTREDQQDECGIRDRDGQERQCEGGSLCLLEGILNRCIRMPRDGDPCERRRSDQGDQDDDDEDDDDNDEELDDSDLDFFTRIEGATERLRTFSLRFSAETGVPCSNGSHCSEQGQCLRIEGPCINTRNTMDTEVDCDENGNFRPLQCHQVSDGTHTCHCVHPRNGSMVPNTMRRGITQREDAPDCESRVFRFCNYQQDGRNFVVRHGETFVDRQNYTRCRCNDGSPMSCRVDSRVNCRALNPGESPQDCRRRNVKIPHGTTETIGRCNMCGCNNGRLTCTDIEECEDEGEEDDEQERRCERCQDTPLGLVCGRDGRTYLSQCIAMNCSGLRDVDILDGPCSIQPICRMFPCKPGLTCIPLGGRSCLRIDGCSDDERRICVNRTALRCRAFNAVRNGFDTDENDIVCGSDGNTYKSFCHLIQMAPPNTKIAHAGRCDREECRGGQVCGTDGVTYNSTCHLRSQSANAQVDYRGACEDGRDRKPWEICRSIRDERKLCEDTQETCTRRVLSRDGCCPICGGITTLAIDRDALDEYSRATDSDANLDAFMARMTRGDIIPTDVRRRCTVEVTHVRNSTQTNIEVKIIAKNKRDDSDFCHNSSLTFAYKINNATSSTSGSDGGTVVNSTLPVEVSFARAAAAAPLIANSDQQGDNGAPSIIIPSSFVYIMLLGAALLAALL